MNKFIKPVSVFLILSFLGFCACSEKRVESKEVVILPPKDSSKVVDSIPKTIEPAPEKLVAKSRKDLDAVLKSFLSEKDLESLMDDDDGVFYIEDGPGATPIYKQLYSKYDLLGEDAYHVYFRDHESFPQQFYFPEHTDPCSVQQEGYYVIPVPEKKDLLVSIYKLISDQNNVKPKPELLDKLTEIDQSVVRILMVYAKGKNGETVRLKFYLSQKGKSLILSVIDARTCSA